MTPLPYRRWAEYWADPANNGVTVKQKQFHNPINGQFMSLSAGQRFGSMYLPEPNSGCWLWVGQTDSKGYGNFKVFGKKASAHRFSWTLHNGDIPDGMLVCHKCDVRICVNPDHLFIGSHRDNTIDMWAKGRGWRTFGERSSKAKLSDADVKAIRADGRDYRQIADEYGLKLGHVYKIITRKLWKHLP